MNDKYLNHVKANNLDLFENGLFSDFSIKVNDEIFRCHKFILYSGSEYFKGFLNFNPNAEETKLSEIVSVIGIKNCLMFLYNIGCDPIITNEHCVETYVSADYLQIGALKSLSSEKISANINCNNAFGILRFSIIYNDKRMRMKAQNFINNNFNNLCFDNKDFLSLQFDSLSEMVSDEKLSSTDSTILKALLKWADYDLSNRMSLLKENMTKIIQLHLISSDQWNILGKEFSCSDFILCIKQMSSPSSYYTDKPHRIGTPIVLHCIGSHNQERLEWSNYFYVDKVMKQLNPMSKDRFNHKICSSSTFIFVIGGESSESFIHESCERYNLVERIWMSMASLDFHRTNFTVACLEGFVYLFGGYIIDDNNNNCEVSRDILIYDSGNDFWTKTNFRTPFKLIDAAAVGHCGLIYVAGGVNESKSPTNKIREFDPATGEWTEINTNGLPDDIFSESNISRLSIAAGGWSVENDGFLLLSGKVNDCFMMYVYHFSINRWRLSTNLQDLYNNMDDQTNRIMIYCQREFISILSTVSVSILEQLHLCVPHLYGRDDDLFAFLKFQVTNDWSGEIDLKNPCLIKSFSTPPGFQFLMAALVTN